MVSEKLPPSTFNDNSSSLFPRIHEDPFQYVDTSTSLVPFTKLNPPPLTWLWHHLIPIGSLTLLEGPASLGKSTLLLDLAARLSSGLPLPDPTPDHQLTPPVPPTFIEPAPIMFITPDDPANVRLHTFFSQNSSRHDLLYSFTIQRRSRHKLVPSCTNMLHCAWKLFNF